jgi:tRNA-dihydrouridine synthase B
MIEIVTDSRENTFRYIINPDGREIELRPRDRNEYINQIIDKEVKHYLETGEELPPLSFDWCMEVLRQEVVDSVNLLDERRGILHVRRHLAASPLFKGIPNFRNTRISMLRAETKEELFRIFEEITSQRKENPEI